MNSMKVKITEENIVRLINAKQIYISRNGAVGMADYEILVYCSSFAARPATFADVPALLGQVVCIEENSSVFPREVTA